jgi:hypothetical protein
MMKSIGRFFFVGRPRATKFRSGRMNSDAKAASVQLSSSSTGCATPAICVSRTPPPRAEAGAAASCMPNRAASTPAMYSSSSTTACVCAPAPITPVSQKLETSAAICIAGATEK